MKLGIPQKLQSLFWSADVSDLDLEKHKAYIINQTLMYGLREELKWLFKTYPVLEIKKTFIQSPDKIYTPAAFHFVKTMLLNIRQPLKTERYVRTLPRYIGS